MDAHEAVNKISSLISELTDEVVNEKKYLILKDSVDELCKLQKVDSLNDMFMLKYFNEYKNQYTP